MVVSVLIIIFGALMLLAGLTIIINPDSIFGMIKNNTEKLMLQILAIVVRLVLGTLLLYYSGISKYPFIIEIIGWLFIITAVFLTVIGPNKFKRLMSWALSLAKPYGRVGGILAVCFGAFLIYAFI